MFDAPETYALLFSTVSRQNVFEVAARGKWMRAQWFAAACVQSAATGEPRLTVRACLQVRANAAAPCRQPLSNDAKIQHYVPSHQARQEVTAVRA